MYRLESKVSDVNRQISEQLNRSLRKLSVILAYSEWENYLKILEFFFVTTNLKTFCSLVFFVSHKQLFSI